MASLAPTVPTATGPITATAPSAALAKSGSPPAHEAPGRASTTNLASRRRGPPQRTPFVPSGRRVVVVEEPGPATTVQDAGRPNVAAIGVPKAGAADELARRLANRLVGNADGDGVLEATLRGPRLRFEVATFVAVVGDVPLTVDGRPVPVGAPIPIAAGQVVSIGANRRGCRSVLAVAGGLRAPMVMGSVSSDLLCGLGPGPLQAGDQLEIGTPGRPAGQLRLALHGAHCLAAWAGLSGVCSGPQPPRQDPVVRVLPGPDATRATLDQLATGRFEVLPDSNRVGVRLGGTSIHAPVPGAPSASRPVTSGVVQLPPDGRPIVLLCDHATVGGYRVIATVASADLPVVAQLRPGAVLGFAVVDPAAAIEARHQVRDALARAIVGRFPTQAG